MSIDQNTAALAGIGLTAPKETAHWLGIRDALLTDLEQHAPTDPRNAVHDLTTDNITATVDHLTRRAVDHLERRKVTMNLVEAAEARASAAIRQDAENLLTAARKSFDKAAAVIAKHADAYDPTDDPERVLRHGTDAAEAWTAIRDASAALDAHLPVWTALFGRARNVDTVVASYDGDHWRRVDAQAIWDQPNRWHALTAAGYRLRLNSLADIKALVAATPVKELRSERTRENGITSTRLVRS